MQNSLLVKEFIDQIWNKQAFEKLDLYLDHQYHDHSLPPDAPAGKDGTKDWIIGTGVSFEHHTIIECQVTEGDYSMVKIRMGLKHIGTWRNIQPTGISLQVIGYRHFKIKNGKIVAHHALIDGQAIENALRCTSHGCRAAK